MIEVPKLILPRSLYKTPELLMPDCNVGIEGYIGWELIRNGKVIRSSRPQPNLITDAALDGMGNGTSVTQQVSYVGVGTNNTAPANSDTSLGAQVGSRTNANGGFSDVGSSGPSFSYWQRKVTRLFVEAEAIGNLTEVGFFSGAVGGTMFNRQLFKDNLGNPTVIVKTGADQLKIELLIRFYPNTATVNQVMNFSIYGSNVSTSIDTRAIAINGGGWALLDWGNFSGTSNVVQAAYENNALPATTTTQSGANNGFAGTLALQAYTNGNFYRDLQVTYPPANTNFATGIGSISWGAVSSGGDFMWIHTFTPKVPKTAADRAVFMLRTSWSRH